MRRQILTAALLLVLPLVAAAFWAGSINYNERLSDLQDQTTSTATTMVAYLNRYLESYDTLAAGIGTHPDIRSLDPQRATDLLAALLRERQSGLLNLLLVDRSGRFVAAAVPERPPTPWVNWAKAVLSSGRPAVGALQKDPLSGEYTSVLAYPVTDGTGKLLGALGLPLRLGALQDVFTSVPLPPSSVVTLTDPQSVILARSLEPARYIGRSIEGAHPRALDQVPSRVELTGLDGVRRVFSNAVVPRGPWLVSVGIPVSVAAQKAQSLWWRSLGILVGGLVAYLGLALILSNRLVGAVSSLEQAANRIAQGDLAPPEAKPMPSAELAQLQDAFAAMVRKLKAAREAIDAQMAEERRIREELQALQRQVIRQERLAAVGLLVSGVAHELNNPLQAIMGFAELLHMQKQLPAAVLEDLALIQKESARACSIIRNLSKFSRQQPAEAAPVKLQDVISSVTELRQRRLQQDQIELELDTQSAQPTVAVFTELQQVILNFVVNAEQSLLAHETGRPKKMVIRTRDVDGKVRLEVQDSGPGVHPNDEAKLFQPFFTTKPVGQGTGLGLSVSYGIIHSLGGTIGYRPAEGGGAVFYFELPADHAA